MSGKRYRFLTREGYVDLTYEEALSKSKAYDLFGYSYIILERVETKRVSYKEIKI